MKNIKYITITKYLKEIAFMLPFVILFLGFYSNIFAYDASNFNPEYGVTTSNVNLRKSANMEISNIITTVPKNTNIRIVATLNNFYIVQLQDNKIGAISKDYVNIQDEKGTYAKYETIEKYFGNINSNLVNLRGGPGTDFSIYKKLVKDEQVEIIGKINDFLLVVTEDDFIGMVRSDLVSQKIDVPSTTLDSYSQALLDLINNERQKNSEIKLEILPKLQEVATLKANDMVKNNYFLHTSPTYGTPFEMMKNYGITYKSAGENIAGNSTVEGAFSSWINSEKHKQNILSNAYNYIGIGIAPSEKYGYIFVVMFIRKIIVYCICKNSKI